MCVSGFIHDALCFCSNTNNILASASDYISISVMLCLELSHIYMYLCAVSSNAAASASDIPSLTRAQTIRFHVLATLQSLAAFWSTLGRSDVNLDDLAQLLRHEGQSLQSMSGHLPDTKVLNVESADWSDRIFGAASPTSPSAQLVSAAPIQAAIAGAANPDVTSLMLASPISLATGISGVTNPVAGEGAWLLSSLPLRSKSPLEPLARPNMGGKGISLGGTATDCE